MNRGARTPAAARDASGSRTRILDAATAEFARHGLGGARVDRIAAAASANKRMLYYYFGNKEALFAAVLEAAYESIRQAEKKLSLLDVPPDEGVRRLIAFTWNYYIEHPEFLTLLNSENLHEARHLKVSSHIRSMNSPVIETLAEMHPPRPARENLQRQPRSRCSSTSRSPDCRISTSRTTTRSPRCSRATWAAPAAGGERLAHMTELVLGYLRHGPPPARRAR